jgi:uncharacterized protein YbcI
MASTMETQSTRGSLTAAISNAVVRIMSDYTGRGPTKARTTIHDDVVLVLMKETLTKAERSLLRAGQGDFVLQTRKRHQDTMRDDLVTAIELLCERQVIAFMSANHLEPDMASEIFVLESRADSHSETSLAPLNAPS